ncbi:MAG: ComF family protein [Sterolibacterium sp.]|jgi:ComF family protein|nr:ComF family protein [Sterolibacterium sp.]
MNILTQARQTLIATRNRLLPQDCFLCAAPAGSALLCAACTSELPVLPAPNCPICALPTPAGSVCGACLKSPPYFDATTARYRYGFPVDRLVQALKYQHTLAVARCCAQAMLQSPPAAIPKADLLMALPLSSQRLAERGFNQAVEIARPLAQQLHLPLHTSGYARTIHTPPQARLPWKERHKNIRGAFECSLNLAGKHILVIDDVMTTGSSLNEFARTLKKHGAARVSNWVYARALRD